MKKALVVLLALVRVGRRNRNRQRPEAGRADPIAAAPPKSSQPRFQETVTTNGIFKHLNALQGFADKNGGTRTSGTKGYDQSAAYVAKQLKSYGYDVERQKFDFDSFFEDAPTVFEQTAPTPTTYVEGTDYSTMEFSGSGDVTAELVAVDLILPPPAESGSTSGCEPADFPAQRQRQDRADAAGHLRLLGQGRERRAAGAIGSVIFNEGQEGRTDIIEGTLGVGPAPGRRHELRAWPDAGQRRAQRPDRDDRPHQDDDHDREPRDDRT